MNPRIYKDKAAKQAEYREAKKLSMTCAEYRAHIATGGKPAPETNGNKGWYGSGIHSGLRYNEKTFTTERLRKFGPAAEIATITPPVKLWGIEMTPAQKEAIEARDREKVKRQSARWAKKAAKITTPVPMKPKSATAIKRAVRFYTGMMEEFFSVQENHWDKRDHYTQLLTLHGGDGRYPWTSPTKGYTLPPTKEEFEAEYDAAMKDFDALMAQPTVTPELTPEQKRFNRSLAAARIGETE